MKKLMLYGLVAYVAYKYLNRKKAGNAIVSG